MAGIYLNRGRRRRHFYISSSCGVYGGIKGIPLPTIFLDNKYIKHRIGGALRTYPQHGQTSHAASHKNTHNT